MFSSGNKNGGSRPIESRSNSGNSNRNSKKTESKPKKDRFRPLRILIVEPKGNYCKVVWCAIGVGFTHVLLGATIMTTLMYSIQTGDTHVCVCTSAYHFFSAEAILSLNYANGWSSPLKLRHKRFAHVFLNMCALVFAVTGAAMISISKGITATPHGITGAITTVLAGLTFLSGPCALFGGRYLKILHVSVGMPTFLLSSICLCLGIWTSAFRSWAGEPVVFILMGFVIFYTAFIIITCFMKCVMRI